MWNGPIDFWELILWHILCKTTTKYWWENNCISMIWIRAVEWWRTENYNRTWNSYAPKLFLLNWQLTTVYWSAHKHIPHTRRIIESKNTWCVPLPNIIIWVLRSMGWNIPKLAILFHNVQSNEVKTKTVSWKRNIEFLSTGLLQSKFWTKQFPSHKVNSWHITCLGNTGRSVML